MQAVASTTKIAVMAEETPLPPAETETMLEMVTQEALNVVVSAAAVAVANTAAVVVANTALGNSMLLSDALFATPSTQSFFDILHTSVSQYQPLADILAQNRVVLGDPDATSVEEIDISISYLDRLIQAIEKAETEYPYSGGGGRAPGFFLKQGEDVSSDSTLLPSVSQSIATDNWASYGSSYETLAVHHNGLGGQIPLPTFTSALRCFRAIREVWLDRRSWAVSGEDISFCSCIGQWGHCPNHILIEIANQSLEQLMVREASDCVTARILKDEWHQSYNAEHCTSPDQALSYMPSTPIRLLTDRDKFIAALCENAMFNTQHSIRVSTSYVFSDDVAHRWLLLDFYPFLARTRGIKIEILIDLLTVESAVIKSAFEIATGTKKRKERVDRLSSGTITSDSFLEYLPPGCPGVSDLTQPGSGSNLDFFGLLMKMVDSVPSYQVRWWCARDATDKYRIKNHAKCVLFDEHTAIMGGSNVTPTVKAASTELDVLVGGEIAHDIGKEFEYFWNGASDRTELPIAVESNLPNHQEEKSSKNEDFGLPVDMERPPYEQKWDDECRVAFIRSTPSSKGEDCILRAVLGAIYTAETSVKICMGHCNIPMPIVLAFQAACDRGVNVQVVVNSMYSNDLRGGQKDLFLSIRDAMRICPDIEVWTTAILPLQDEESPSNDEIDKACQMPPFLHSKYVVVDEKWSALGSWNMWTRSAFYEMEQELLIHSEIIAQRLTAKFEIEKKATSVLMKDSEECAPGNGFCPIGCKLCQPFGPFFSD